MPNRSFRSILLFFIGLFVAQPNTGQPITRRSLADLQKQIELIAQPAQGRVGVAATVLETGELVALHGDEQFPMQSVYKFPIGMAVLHQVDQGKLTLNQKVQITKGDYISERQHSPIRDKYPNGIDMSLNELLRYAVSESDGSASDVLLRVVGGAPVINAYLQSLGVTGVKVINTEREIGSDNAVQYKNWAQPTQMVVLLKALQEGRGVSKASQTLLMRLMTETPTGLHRLKALLPAGTVVTHKTGSSGTVNGLAAATNDVGLITVPNGKHLAVVVFVADSKADETTRESVIANVAKVIFDYWR